MKEFVIIWGLLIMVIPTLGQELTGTDIIQRASDIMNQDQVQAIMELTITTPPVSSGRLYTNRLARTGGKRTCYGIWSRPGSKVKRC